MKYFVYILYSEAIQKFYIGQTQNIASRLKRHNSGAENFTSKGIPWHLVWFTTKDTRSEAIILERKLKNLSQKRLIRFIIKYHEGIQNKQIVKMLSRVSDDQTLRS